MSCVSLPGLSSPLFNWKKPIVVAALACGLGLSAATADAQCSQTGGNYTTTTYTFSGTQPANKVVGAGGVSTISTSTITVPSFPSGSVVTCVSVYLSGVTADGIDKAPDGYEYASMDYAAMMLTAPSGQKFEFLGGTGDGTDGYDGNGQSGPYGLASLNITVWDGASSHAPGFPTNNAWQNNCTSTACPEVKSTSYFMAAGDGNPSLGGSSQWAVSDGSATFASIFANQATPNGVWTLSLNDDDPYTKGDPITINSWSLVLTVEQTANLNTTTTLSSNSTNNTSWTSSPNGSVTLTATVTAGGSSVNSGTVKFSNGTSTISGCSTQPLSNGTATCVTTFTTEGIQGLSAAYAGASGYNASSSGTLDQYVKNHSTLTSGEYCNAGAISINGPVTSPYPSVINVGTDTTALTGTVADVTITLKGLASTTGLGQGYAFLLVAPDTSKAYNLDFLASAGTTPQPSETVTIEDDYPSAPSGGELDGTYAATDLNTSKDAFAAAISPAPALPATDNYAAPEYFDPSGSLTLAQAFGGANGNGDWTLYAYNEESDLITVNSGWCMSFEQNTGAATTTTLASSANPEFTEDSVTLTATVKSGGNPVTSGTVTFTENGAAPAGVTNNAVTLNGSGTAAITTTTLAEGDHDIVATYSGVANTWDTSFTSLWQRMNNVSSESGLGTSASPAKYCNAGGFTLPNPAQSADGIGAAYPNPTNVIVAGLPGTNSSVAVELDGFQDPGDGSIGDTASLIVGPNGAGLDFFSGTGVTNVTTLSKGTYLFEDTAPGRVPQTAFGPDSYQPTSYDTTDTFFANSSGLYALPGTLDYAAPHSDAFTFNTDNSEGDGAFSSLSGNGNGTWSLYFNQNIHATGAGATGWCVDFVQDLPAASVSLSSNSTFVQGEAESFTVGITNNGPGSTGDLNGTSPMTVTDTLNSAFTYESGSGTGWSCNSSGQTVTCTNGSSITETNSYPTLTINVMVSATANGQYSNSVTAIGAGVSSTASNTDNVTVDVPPAITSGNSVTFTAGTLGSWEITATGYPTPTYSESGALPGGITLNSTTGILSGTANAGTGGTWPIVITATNGVGSNATQNFTLTIDQAPAITSAASTTFTVGSSGSFSVTASGYPAPTFSKTGSLPSGVTLSSAGALAGTPAAGTGGSYPITITASNAISPNATQSFTLTVYTAQTITFPQPTTPAANGTPVTLTASASSGLAITYSVVSGPATVSGSTLTFTGPGTVVVEADQSGNGTYAAATPVQVTITVVDVVSYAAPTTAVNTTSATQTAAVNFTTAGTLGSINVLTQGAANLDFKLITGGGSCAAGTAYTPGQTCTVEYSFTPMSPGGRSGAVVLQDGSGNVLGTSYLGGVGSGPQGLFTNGVLTNVASGLDTPRGASVDGAGDVYIVEQGNGNVDEFAAGTGVETVLTTAGNSPAATAVDGAGNIYFSSTNPAAIYELAVGAGTPVEIASGWTPDDVLVADGAGNLYSSDENTGAIYEIAAGTRQTSLALPSGIISRIIGMTVDGSGNLYAADFNNNVMYEIVVGSGTATELFSGNGLSNPHGLTIDPAGNLYVTNYTGGDVQKYTNVAGTWVDVSLPTGSNGTRGITTDSSGNLIMLTDSTVYRDTRTTASLSFGSQAVGNQSAAQATGFENDGNALLAISALSVTGTSFTLDSGTTTCSTTNALAVAGNCNVGATFEPQSAGAFTGDVNITDNTLNNSGTSQQAALTGTGTAATPVVQVTAASNTYGLSPTPLTATVTYGGVQPTGTVTIQVDSGAIMTASCIAGTGSETCSASYPTSTLTAGSHTITAGIVADANYNVASNTGMLTINQATPTVSVTAYTITYGTALSNTQLTGTASSTVNGAAVSVPGAFAFTSAAGTVLGAGGNQSESVTFTPSDTTDYTTATTTVLITVDEAPVFNGGSGVTMTVLTNNQYLIFTSGYPIASIAETGALPSGVTFVDDGNGRGTLGGEPAANTGGVYPLTFTASNGIVPNGTLNYTLTIDQPTSITSANNATFSAGAAGTFTVTTAGYPLPTSFTETGTLPAGVTFVNNGDGTATLSGTPAAGGAYPLSIAANNGKGGATQNFTLTVNQSPVITSAGSTTFTVGATGSFTVSATGYPLPTFTEAGTLPAGVTLSTSGVLSGVPALGTAGSYPFTIMAGNGVGTNADESFTLTVNPPAGFVVTTTADDATGTPSNCPVPSTGNTCTLRDALAAASAAGAGIITFDPTAFASAQTITLTNGTLNLPAYTSITGATTGSGTTLVNLVTVNGNNASTDFSVASGVTGASIANLIITGGSNSSGTGGGLYNDGTLTITGSSITASTAENGGGVYNDASGVLTITASTLSGNQAQDGAGIANGGGSLSVYGSTISGNIATQYAGGIADNGTTTVANSTISGNQAAQSGGGIASQTGTTSLANSIVSGNTGASSAADDIDSASGNGYTNLGGDVAGVVNGNAVNGTAIALATLANYGGPMQTMLPEPGSPAICGGLLTNLNLTGLTTDQRGEPNTNTTYLGYNSTTPCVDAGAVQTNYAIGFTAQPPATAQEGVALSPAPVVSLTESGTPIALSAGVVTMSDTANVLTGTLTETFASGAASFGNLIIPTPAAGDTLNATLALNSSVNVTAQASQSISVSGIAGVTLSTTNLGFPATDVGTTSTLPVTVTNSGSTNLTLSLINISGVNPTSFSHTSNCGGHVITPGNYCTIQVIFTPAAAGPYSATLNITDSATGSPKTVTLSGNGNAPTVLLSTTGLSFPSTNVGSTSTLPVTVTNTGTTNLTVSVISNSGTNPTSFSHTSNCGGIQITPGNYCTIQVNFTPAAAGPYSATLNITDNATGSPQTVTLSGNGNAPTVMLSTTSLSFPTTNVGSTSTLPVTVTNSGTTNLMVSAIGNSGINPTDFSHTSNCGGSPITPGNYCTIQVNFTPAAGGTFSATLNITDNATGSPQTVTLSGNGNAPTVTLSTTSLNFPATNVSSTSTLPVTVTNSGTANLTVSVINNSGLNPTSFSHTSNCGGNTIAPGNYCTIQVNFSPAGGGPFSATLNITDNATGSPQTVTLSGNGNAPTVTLSTTGLSFPSTKVGKTSTLPVTVTNSGTANLTVSVINNSGTNPTDFTHTSNCGGSPITPGNYCTIEVIFNPAATGPLSAILNITDNATGSPQTVTLNGTGQ